MAKKNTNELDSLTNEQIAAEAAKIMTARAKQRERMKARSKAKRIQQKAILELAKQRGLVDEQGNIAA